MNRMLGKTGLVAAVSASVCVVLIPGTASAQSLPGCATAVKVTNPFDTCGIGGGACPANPQPPNYTFSFLVENNDFNSDGQQINVCPNSGAFSLRVSDPVLGYPNILQGQALGQGPTANWVTQKASAITTWPVAWNASGNPPVPTGSPFWNTAMEVWASRTSPPPQCGKAGYAHPDGAELMIWTQGSRPPLPQPSANSLPVTIDGYLWDVYISGQWAVDGNCRSISWNYIAYFPQGNVAATSLSSVYLNYSDFVNDAKTRSTGSKGAPGSNNYPACQNGGPLGKNCFDDSWYINSIQAGFENMGAGVGLESDGFYSSQNTPVLPNATGDAVIGRCLEAPSPWPPDGPSAPMPRATVISVFTNTRPRPAAGANFQLAAR